MTPEYETPDPFRLPRSAGGDDTLCAHFRALVFTQTIPRIRLAQLIGKRGLLALL